MKKCIQQLQRQYKTTSYLDDFIKLVKNPEEAIEFFNQPQFFPSKYGLQLKNWISNNNSVTKSISEDLQLIRNTKQVEVEPNTERSSVLGLQWTLLMIDFNCAEVRTKKFKQLKSKMGSSRLSRTPEVLVEVKLALK